MDKAYSRIIWQNQPSTATALGATNLNKMDIAINAIDDRVVAMDTTKAEQSTVNDLVKSITYNDGNGVITITKQNGTKTNIDTKLEKLAVNFSYNPTTQKLIITLDDGTTQEVDLSSLISQYEFVNTGTVSFVIEDGKVKANVVNGSITAEKLQPNYLSDITVQAQTATTQANKSKRYAVGGVETGDTIDNAKYYKEQAEIFKNQAQQFRDEAEDISNVGIASDTRLGLVKGNGGINVGSDGSMWVNYSADKATGLTATSIACPNADDGLVEIAKIEGASSQVVTETGKNILPRTQKPETTANGITFTPNADGSITVNGTATAQADFNIFGSYTSTIEVFRLAAGGYTLKGTGNASVVVFVGGTSKTLFTAANGNGSNTLTQEESIVFALIRVSSGTTVNNLTVYPQLEVGSSSTAYEPYIPNSPSPEYPSSIISPKNFDVVVTNENLLDSRDFRASATFDGITLTNTDGKLILNGTATADVDIYICGTTNVRFNPYAITFLKTLIGLNTNLCLSNNLGLQNYFRVGNTYPQNTAHSSVIEGAFVRIASGTTYDNTELNIMLNVGTSVKPYTPNKTSKITIPYDLGSLSNGAKNEIVKITSNTYKYTQRKSLIILNGSETNWTIGYTQPTNPTLIRFVYSSTLIKMASPFRCDKFKYSNNTNYATVQNECIIHHNESGQINVVMKKARLTTIDVAGFKTWLMSNPIAVEYELATPIENIIELPYLSSYKGTTHLMTNANPQVNLVANFKSELWSRDYLQDLAISDGLTADKIVQTDAVNDTSKVPSAAVTYAHGLEIDANTTAINKLQSVKTATITTTWTGASAPYTQDIAVSGLTVNDVPIADLVLSSNAATAQNELKAWNKIHRIVTGANKITVYCYGDKPTIPLNIQLKGV